MTMIIVTHEMNFARQVADRVLFMDRGVIVEEDTPARLFEIAARIRARARFSRTCSIADVCHQ